MHEARIRVQVFQIILQLWRVIMTGNETARKIVDTSRAQHLLRSVLAGWKEKLQQQRDKEVMAFEYCAPRLRQDAVQPWHAKYEHQIQLVRWSAEVLHYFRATRTFKALQAAVAQSRKKKRRDAYTQVRPTVKMNLARSLIQRWRDKTVAALAHVQPASEFIDSRQTKLVSIIVGQWHISLIRKHERNNAAIGQERHQLLARSLGQWLQRLHGAEQDAQAASSFARSYTEKAAYDCLRRLQLRTLERQALTAKANTVFS